MPLSVADVESFNIAATSCSKASVRVGFARNALNPAASAA